MAETTTETTQQETGQEEQSKTFTQDEVNALIGKEKTKLKARYSDYEELKQAAAKLQEIEDANKSDLQKATDRIAELEAQINERKEADERDALLAKIADEHKVPAEYRCLLTANDEDGLTQQAQLLAEKFAEPSSNEGKPPAQVQAKKTNGQIFAEWFEGQM